VLLLLQVLGVLAGAGLLAAVGGRGLGPRSYALAAALVPVGAACVLLGGSLWPTTRNMLAERARQAAIPPAEAELAPGKSANAKVDFVEWARQRIPPGEKIYVFAGDSEGYQWTTFRLLPDLAVDRPEDADWLVFYDQEPDESGDYDPSQFEAPEEFEDGFAVARRAQ
jgi:hypothetical protein